MELPADLDGLHAVMKRRIRDQSEIEECRLDYSSENKVAARRAVAAREIRHVVGQTGCFCLDCLLHRKQEWRIGDVNTAIVGPRDQWQQYTWGNAERQCLYSDESNSATKPTLTPAISEKIRVHDSKDRIWTVDRAAKFVAVASGKYHTLMLSESAAVFSSGDNTYGALGVARVASTSRSAPTKVEIGLDEVGGCVKIVAASGFASFALVVLPIPDPVQRPTSKEGRQNRGRLTSLERMARGRAHSIQRMSTQAKLDVAMNAAAVNNLLSWGRGDYGVLGHGDTQSSAAPRVIKIFNSMRVTGVSAGLHHVLVLTELDGVYAFGDGSNGKLGLGDTNPRLSPTRISSLDGLNVVHVSAGDEHSVVMSGETFFNRQVYSWGLGKNGRLGHNDELTRLKPTRVNFFRGRKCLVAYVCGHGELAVMDSSVTVTRIHGDYDVPDPDTSSTCILHPIKIELPELSLISAKAGRGRTFVWGDRAIEREKPRPFGGNTADSMCRMLPEYESLTSDSFRIIYRCGPCQLNTRKCTEFCIDSVDIALQDD
ncbi:Regulator of chromosome condensation (RCC1)-like protein [Phytophthora cinnamomi]|uniref:Regulator of chromosome condensation (RCC1)-like protein n=1 Tax=Phytophthora cinnamomi TaxID=4785 RepID=UPI00355A6F04|nr:Regulator of chromosome condensation (RCC1)-like protein [Phytophthora cinnamomi]